MEDSRFSHPALCGFICDDKGSRWVSLHLATLIGKDLESFRVPVCDGLVMSARDTGRSVGARRPPLGHPNEATLIACETSSITAT